MSRNTYCKEKHPIKIYQPKIAIIHTRYISHAKSLSIQKHVVIFFWVETYTNQLNEYFKKIVIHRNKYTYSKLEIIRTKE
jgi:hypothetical protein